MLKQRACFSSVSPPVLTPLMKQVTAIELFAVCQNPTCAWEPQLPAHNYHRIICGRDKAFPLCAVHIDMSDG